MERYVDVRPWLFWEERWDDQAISARVRPGVRPPGLRYEVGKIA